MWARLYVNKGCVIIRYGQDHEERDVHNKNVGDIDTVVISVEYYYGQDSEKKRGV